MHPDTSPIPIAPAPAGLETILAALPPNIRATLAAALKERDIKEREAREQRQSELAAGWALLVAAVYDDLGDELAATLPASPPDDFDLYAAWLVFRLPGLCPIAARYRREVYANPAREVWRPESSFVVLETTAEFDGPTTKCDTLALALVAAYDHGQGYQDGAAVARTDDDIPF